MSHALGTRGAIPGRKGQSVTRFARWNRDNARLSPPVESFAPRGAVRVSVSTKLPARLDELVYPNRSEERQQRLTSVYGIERAPIKADRTAIVEADECTRPCVCPGYRSRDRTPARSLSLTPAAENVTDVRGMRLRSGNSGEAAATGAINKANGP